MIQAQVVPQYVNQPRQPQHRNGSIKDQAGQYYSVDKNSLHLFQQGQPANITYEQKQGQRGPYNVVTAVNGQPIGGGMTQAGQAAPPVQRQTPVGDTKAEEMFVMGVVGRAMGSGQFAVTDIGLLAKAATQAWRERERDRSEQPAGDPRDDLDDGWPGPDG